MWKLCNLKEVGQADNKEKLIKQLQLLTTIQSPLEVTRNLDILLRSMPLEPKQQFKNNMKKYKPTSRQNPKSKNKKTSKECKLKTEKTPFNLRWKS